MPRFGALSNVGVGVGAASESGSGFRCPRDVCPVGTMDAGSSTLWSAGLGSRVNEPWCWSNVLGTVPKPERRPTERGGESIVCWSVCGPSPVEEEVRIIVGDGPTNIDLSSRHS